MNIEALFAAALASSARAAGTVSGRAAGGGRALGPRLHTPLPLAAGALVTLPDEQRHYLATVMRVRPGRPCRLFNAADGEFEATVDRLDRRAAEVRIGEQLRPPPGSAAGPTLLFGVLKGPRLGMLVEKATELGVHTLQPVVTEYCVARTVSLPRLAAIATEAAEQSGRLTVPRVLEAAPLLAVLRSWDPSVPLCACDERGGGVPLAAAGVGCAPGLLVGPEGGFSPAEFEAMAEMGCVVRVSLGHHILRAETAAMAGLALLGAQAGQAQPAADREGDRRV
jgi:16S rRNA (uracil1498-N3)-methyltransferase